MRRFFISPEQIQQNPPLITGQDAHHIRKVLRLRTGDAVIVFDGTGAEYEARIDAIAEDNIQIRLIRPIPEHAESGIRLTLAQGYLKDKKMDLLVRMLTELGVTRLLPFIAGRSVAVPDEKRSLNRQQRWQKISQEAVKQCRRGTMMTIAPTTGFDLALAESLNHDLKLIFWEGQGGNSLTDLVRHQKPGAVFVLVGPEGGFEDQEYEAARQNGFHAIHMGPRILRAETAALAACTMVQYAFGDMG